MQNANLQSEVIYQGHTQHKACEGHLVQFYSSDRYLIESLAEFVALGVGRGEGVLILATEEHSDKLRRELESTDVSIQELMEKKQLRFIDANRALLEILVDNQPRSDRFLSFFSPYINESKKLFKKVRIYGELVNTLCERQEYKAAQKLEDFWNELLSGDPAVSVMCGYVKAQLSQSDYDVHYQAICDSHSHLIGDEAEVYLQDSNKLFKNVAMLQQRAAAYKLEMKAKLEIDRELYSLRRTRNHSKNLGALGEACMSITQELNNPLAIIKLSVDQLNSVLGEAQDGKFSPQMVQEKLKIIDTATNRIAKTIKGISVFAKAKLSQDEEFNLPQVLRKVFSMAESEAARKNIKLQHNLPTAELLCLGNPEQMEEVFLNLFSAAISSINQAQKNEVRDGKIEVTIDLVAEDRIELVFKDNGLGLADADCRRLALSSHKGDFDRKLSPLISAYNTVKDFGGSIYCSSQLGKRTQFRVVLVRA